MAYRITVKTEQYQWTHGHTPRSTGLSRWAFQLGTNPEPWCITAPTYSLAKRAAIQEARRQGAHSITVLP